MKYLDAVRIVEANKHLIGKKWDGATVDEIIVAPTDSEVYAEFEKLYFQTLDAQQSIIPFINTDVEVFIVCDKERMRTQALFVYSSIYELPESFNVARTIE